MKLKIKYIPSSAAVQINNNRNNIYTFIQDEPFQYK